MARKRTQDGGRRRNHDASLKLRIRIITGLPHSHSAFLVRDAGTNFLDLFREEENIVVIESADSLSTKV